MQYNPFTKFDQDWAIVTAGDEEDHNSMTISWGSMGTVWGKDVITIYIRPDRYTFNYLRENEFFTVSFYDQKYHESLNIMGNLSGRDHDKDIEADLTPISLDHGISYLEAKETFVCKKIYLSQMQYEDVPDVAKKIYKNGIEPHYIIMGEVIRHVEEA